MKKNIEKPYFRRDDSLSSFYSMYEHYFAQRLGECIILGEEIIPSADRGIVSDTLTYYYSFHDCIRVETIRNIRKSVKARKVRAILHWSEIALQDFKDIEKNSPFYRSIEEVAPLADVINFKEVEIVRRYYLEQGGFCLGDPGYTSTTSTIGSTDEYGTLYTWEIDVHLPWLEGGLEVS